MDYGFEIINKPNSKYFRKFYLYTNVGSVVNGIGGKSLSYFLQLIKDTLKTLQCYL